MERALWREVLCKVQAWGLEVSIFFKVFPQAKLVWLWMSLDNLLWLELLQDKYRDEKGEKALIPLRTEQACFSADL